MPTCATLGFEILNLFGMWCLGFGIGNMRARHANATDLGPGVGRSTAGHFGYAVRATSRSSDGAHMRTNQDLQTCASESRSGRLFDDVNAIREHERFFEEVHRQ
jgi:hypothetical protein